jgi:hypothetical protein
MYKWIVLKTAFEIDIKIYIKIYIKTAPTYFSAINPPSGRALTL